MARSWARKIFSIVLFSKIDTLRTPMLHVGRHGPRSTSLRPEALENQVMSLGDDVHQQKTRGIVSNYKKL